MEDDPKSPRHFFYQPAGESTRALTGFQPTEEKDVTLPTMAETSASRSLEDQEPYYDDEDCNQRGAQFADCPPPPQMKPMSVATGGDYDESSNREEISTQRKACFAAAVSVCFLIVGYLITIRYEAKGGLPGHNNFGSGSNNNNHGSSNHNHPKIEGECTKDGYDKDYFKELMDRVQSWSREELCTTEFPIHDCKCRHPFVAEKQQLRGDWEDTKQMNIDLMEKNYTSRNIQPEVVIYGDSIVEHMLGRQFGKTNQKLYGEHAQATWELLTKRGGGHINGLPMGIAADEMTQLLYRLDHGEMPETLNPKVWWMLIGTNDIGMGCSVSTIVAGNIKLVKEIRERHHDQHGHKTLTPVVINSILPRGKFDLYSEQSPYNIIRRINRQLECYAQLHQGVEFVNVTDTMTESGVNGTFLKEGYFMGDNLHPSAEGQRQWEEVIVSNVMQLMT